MIPAGEDDSVIAELQLLGKLQTLWKKKSEEWQTSTHSSRPGSKMERNRESSTRDVATVDRDILLSRLNTARTEENLRTPISRSVLPLQSKLLQKIDLTTPLPLDELLMLDPSNEDGAPNCIGM
ncbi:hypothetical protein Ciccas_010706 [Cichlidogyrus casuarinus]|uniref:Uncharacterized protein n=1 Tax=Cichlidogyrus casuarinus TaxID=1844966 RepID=A0ABD2PTD7_9PLAT